MSEAHPLIHHHHHHRGMSARTIHFAPLPDPRLCRPRDDDTDDDDDEPVELDHAESPKNSKTLFQFSLSGGRKPSDTSSIASSSMHSLTPTQSIDSTTQPSSKKYRFLRLFRSKDKEHSVTHWSSVNSFGSPAVSDPLFRTQSTTSYRGGNVRSPKSSKIQRPSTADGLLATLHNPRPAQRMLNGRVYGGGKNLFASAPDKEPEFVEWGYGGMGSVKSQREVGGRMWNKVQSESGMMGDGDEDDGGGMTWVKRRREERERKAREEADHKSKEAVAKEEAQKEHDLRAVNVPMHEDQDENDEDDDDSPTEDDKEYSLDEDDDILSDGEARKTSLGAGVEKVSRHHKS
ncbi:hypothetical protein BDZ89DRAFT_1154248 [Hymenopellis radicata]|nr:hypothetical protein BDZ89DRAFT_1154248 [Hymenopellis radicata]